MDSAFPILRLTELLKRNCRIIASDDSHFGGERRFRWIANGGVIQSDFDRYNYEGSARFRLGGFVGFKSNSPNRRFRRVALWSKTSISPGVPAVGETQSYFRPLQLRGGPLANFTALRAF